MSRACWLCAVALAVSLAGCPKPTPPSRPRPPAFDALRAKDQLERRLAQLTRPGAPKRPHQIARTRRDLGWLLWAHLGDPLRAAAAFTRARRDAGKQAAPWVIAAQAGLADVALDTTRAAELWALTLEHLAVPPARALPPPPGVDRHALATLAETRLAEQLRHLRAPWPLDRLRRLQGLALPDEVRAALALTLAQQHRRRGEVKAAATWDRRAGCLPAYRLSKPLGRWPRLDLTRVFPPERAARLRGPVTRSRGCRLGVRNPQGQAGVRYAEVEVRQARGGAGRLQFAWRGPLVVWVNGARLLGPDTEPAPRPILRSLPVRLTPGVNRIRFKLPVAASLRFLHARLVLHPTAPKAPASPGVRRPPASRQQTRLYAPLADLLAVHGALHRRGLPDAGRAAALRLVKRAPRFSWGRLVHARLEQRDPLQPQTLSRNRARAAYVSAARWHPGGARLTLRLAALLRQQNKSKRALQLLASTKPRTADARRLLGYARIQLYRDLRWIPLAAREAAALAKAHPRWLAAWRLHHALSREEHAAAAVVASARRLRDLSASSLAWARVLTQQGRFREALAELTRVGGVLGPRRTVDLRAKWLRRSGSAAAALPLLTRRLAAATWDPERRLALADLLVAAGRSNQARRLLLEGRRLHPEQRDFHRALRALGERDLLADFRVDGAAAEARYRKAGWAPGRRPVYALDRTVIRVLPTGGQMILTHQIVHLRTKEAVHRFGEVRLPAGARVLTLRTRKKDGTTREPEDPGGRKSVSLPDLDVGDLIEVEYAVAQPRAPTWRPGGFYGSRFSFRSVAAHFFRSELVVVAPRSLPLVVSQWGAVPTPKVTQRGALRVKTWTATRVARLEPEPLTATLTGPLPVVRVGARVSWAEFLKQRRELLWGLDTPSHTIRQLARTLCNDKDPAARARRAYDWVQANVEESGGLYVSASHTLARRAGSRLQLLRALLRQCRVGPVQLRFLWPRHLEFPRRRLPPFAAFRQPVLMLRPGGQTVHLLPQLQQAPFGYLPPMLAGAWAVTLEEPTRPPVRTAVRTADEARDSRLRVILRANGSAVVAGTESLRGLVALQLRAAIRRAPARQLRQYLERAFFGRYFAGATLTKLAFGNKTDPDKPLELRYRLSVPQLAHPVRGTLALRAGFYPARVGRQYAARPERTLPLRLGPLGPHRLVADIELPAGFRLARTPAPRSLKSPWGQFRLTVSKRGAGVRLERRLRIPYRVVSPRDYPAFARFAAAADKAELPVLVFSK